MLLTPPGLHAGTGKALAIDVALLGLGVHADPPVKQDSEVKLKSAADDRVSTGPGAPVPGSPGASNSVWV